MFEAFAERDFRRFWTAQFISNIGSWMQAVAQGWLVYHLTDSPFLLGFVGFASTLPMIFLMLPAGAVSDQFDRKRVVVASQWAQAACALFLASAIGTHRIAIWHIVVAALVVGVAQSFSAPAYQAMLLDLLDERARLSNAVAMNSLQFNLSRAIGPLLAGLTLAAYGSFWCFLLNALSFLPIIWVLGRVRDRQQRAESSAALWHRMLEGIAYVRGERILLVLIAIVGAISLFGYPYLTLMPMLARTLFRNDASGLGYLMGAVGAGALLGALVLSIYMPPPRTILRLIVAALLAFAVALVLTGWFRVLALVIPALVLCGLGMVVSLVLCNTSIQQRIPDEMRGRVLSIYTFSFYAFLPFGSLLAGVLAEHRGIGPTLIILGLGLLASGALGSLFLTSDSDRSP